MKHLLIITAVLASLGPAAASARGNSGGYHVSRTYSAPKMIRQTPYQNIGKISPTTGLPMVKPTNGYVRHDGVYVAPYVKSR